MSDEQDKATMADLKERGIRVSLVKMDTPKMQYGCTLWPPDRPAPQYGQSDPIVKYSDSRSGALEPARSSAVIAWPELFD